MKMTRGYLRPLTFPVFMSQVRSVWSLDVVAILGL
jgi:hypothetical protein